MKTILLTIAVLFSSVAVFAQDMPTISVPALSPTTEIKQKVALTEVTLVYSRPSARGRKIYGGLVPFGEKWRTGANASTKLTFTEDVMIAGNNVPAGTYALYTIPGPDEWTIIIHKNLENTAIVPSTYKPEEDLVRFMVKPYQLPGFVETFTMGFSDIKTKSVNIELDWEKTGVSFPVEFDVDSQIDKQIAEIIPMEQPANNKAFNYFRAAGYYFDNDRDLDKAIGWLDDALALTPKDPRFGLLKARILHKKGDKAGALKVIAEANAWATEQKNANSIQQTKEFWDSIK